MSVRQVLRMGDARLLDVAQIVNYEDRDELHSLLEDMRDTMQALNGAGLAAPQIGVGLRVVIFGAPLLRDAQDGQTQDQEEKSSRYPDAASVPETVLINPVITPLGDEKIEDWEGCLSVPGLTGLVPRYAAIRYQGFDENGEVIDRTVSGFHARVVQHECDHLDGILYPMRIRDMRNFGFREVLFPDSNVLDE